MSQYPILWAVYRVRGVLLDAYETITHALDRQQSEREQTELVPYVPASRLRKLVEQWKAKDLKYDLGIGEAVADLEAMLKECS